MNANEIYTVKGLIAQVCQNVGSADDVTKGLARIWLNRALIRFMELGEWPWQKVYGETIDTIATESVVTIPNVIKITSLFMSSPYQKNLVLMEDREFRAKFPNDTFSGCPYFYRTAGTSKSNPNSLDIGLYPIPDAVYTLRFDAIKPICLPSSDSMDIRSVTGMPVTLVDILIEMATAIGFKGDDDTKSAAQMQECLLRLERAFALNDGQINDRLIAAPFETYDSASIGDPLLPPQYS